MIEWKRRYQIYMAEKDKLYRMASDLLDDLGRWSHSIMIERPLDEWEQYPELADQVQKVKKLKTWVSEAAEN